MLAFYREIINITLEFKKKLATFYLKHCEILAGLAFFEWHEINNSVDLSAQIDALKNRLCFKRETSKSYMNDFLKKNK